MLRQSTAGQKAELGAVAERVDVLGLGSATALKADFRNWLDIVVDSIWPAHDTLSGHELIADAELLRSIGAPR